MKLYQFDYFKDDKEPITMTERDAVEKPKIYEFEGAFGKRRIAKESVNKIFSDYGTTVFLLEPNYEKAKEIILEALKKKLDARRKSVLELEKDYQALSNLSFSKADSLLTFDDMVQELRNYITSVPIRDAYDIVESILGREIEFDEVLLNSIKEIWDLPIEKIQESYQKYCQPQAITR